jgi:hypothetical protein
MVSTYSHLQSRSLDGEEGEGRTVDGILGAPDTGFTSGSAARSAWCLQALVSQVQEERVESTHHR